LDDTIGATGYVVNSYFEGFKRINDFKMDRREWYNYLEVSLNMEGYLERRGMCSKETSSCNIKELG
jgi:hypothetical protein